MKKFQDALARDFTVNITVATFKRLIAELAVDLNSLVPMPKVDQKNPDAEPSNSEEATTFLSSLLEDDAKFSQVLYVTIKPEITQDAFDDGLAGQAIELAKMAWLQALNDFFPQAPRKAIVRGQIQARKMQAQADLTGMQRVAAEIAKLDQTWTPEKIAAKTNGSIDKAIALHTELSSKSATGSLGSAASIRVVSPCES